MRASRRRRVLAGAAAAVPAALTVATAQPVAASSPPVTAPPPLGSGEPAQPFCSTELLDASQLAAGMKSTVSCYPTLDESLRSIGVDPTPYAAAGNDPAAFAGVAASVTDPVGTSDVVLATHYDDYLGRGTVLNIGGSTCDGGGISFNDGDFWNDRIWSTAPKGCSMIKHWADANYKGDYEPVQGPANLVKIGGRVSSIRYY